MDCAFPPPSWMGNSRRSREPPGDKVSSDRPAVGLPFGERCGPLHAHGAGGVKIIGLHDYPCFRIRV